MQIIAFYIFMALIGFVAIFVTSILGYPFSLLGGMFGGLMMFMSIIQMLGSARNKGFLPLFKNLKENEQFTWIPNQYNKIRCYITVSPHKGLLSLHYSTKYEKWNFTLTTQYNGSSNIPDTRSNPEEYRLDETSPAYFILHAQVLRKWSKWEVYFGAENLTNYKQENPILAADDPFGDYFDSSMVWGPVIGRSINAGIRFIIE